MAVTNTGGVWTGTAEWAIYDALDDWTHNLITALEH